MSSSFNCKESFFKKSSFIGLLWNTLLGRLGGGAVFVFKFNLSPEIIMRKEGSRCAHPICPAEASHLPSSHYLADIQQHGAHPLADVLT